MKRSYEDKYREKESAVKRRASAVKFAKAIIAVRGIEESHKKELLGVCVWKTTVANGKFNLRYVSKDVLKGLKPIEHEHVTPRKELVRQMLQNPKKVEKILGGAVACLVTNTEHKKLPKTGTGWKRYREEKILVYDRLTKRWLW